MARKPKPKTADEDEAESKRFLDLASELEAAGDLNPTEAAEKFDAVARRLLPSRRKPTQSN